MGSSSSRGTSSKEYFKDKVVWITGASSGLGRELAIESARRGARVVLSSRDESKLQAVRKECAAVGGGDDCVLVKALDIGRFNERGGFIDLAASVADRWGGIDVIIQNAGVSSRSAASDTALDVDIEILNTNFVGPVALTKAVLPYLKKSSAGHVVVINSVQGKIGLGLRTSYAASKHAVTGYFDSLRAELDRDGVAVTQIYPGYIRTALSLNALKGDGSRYAQMDDTTAKGLDPNQLAIKVLEAAAAKKNEVVFAPLDAKAAIFLRNLLPNLLFRILASKARKALAASPADNKKDD